MKQAIDMTRTVSQNQSTCRNYEYIYTENGSNKSKDQEQSQSFKAHTIDAQQGVR